MSSSFEATPHRMPVADPLGSPLARLVFESAREGMLVLAADGTVLAVNHAFGSLYGIDVGETIGNHYSSFTDRLEVRRLGEEAGSEGGVTVRALRGERVEGVTQVIRNLKDGREFVARCGATPLFDGGHLEAVTITVEDVTSWKEAEAALQAQAARYQAVLAAERAVTHAEGGDNALLRAAVDEASRLTGADGACLEIQEGDEMVYAAASGLVRSFVGLRLAANGSLSGRVVREGVSTRSDDTETDDRVDREACRKIGVRSMALVPLRYDHRGFGVLKVLSTRPSAFGEDESQVLDLLGGFLGAAVGRSRSSEALARSGEAFESLLRNSPLGVYAVDADFRLALVSQGAQKVFENVRPLIGRDFAEVMRVVWEEPFASEAIGIFRRVLDTGEPFHAPSTVERRSDLAEEEAYDWKVERIGMPDGRLGAVCSFYDLSERQRVEAELEAKVRERTADLQASNDALNGFMYHVAHDLRAPLRSIASTSRIVMEDFGDDLPPEAVGQLVRQAKAATKLGALIDDLLRLSKLAQQTVERAPIDLTKMAREVGAEALASHSGTSVRVEVQEGLDAWADPRLLRLALGNLIENAVKYSPEGGTVIVGRHPDGVYFVSDEGIGIDPQYFGKVFEPFQRLHNDEAFAGTGIGLSNVKQVVERHGGKIWVESELGNGSTFLFTLGS